MVVDLVVDMVVDNMFSTGDFSWEGFERADNFEPIQLHRNIKELFALLSTDV